MVSIGQRLQRFAAPASPPGTAPPTHPPTHPPTLPHPPAEVCRAGSCVPMDSGCPCLRQRLMTRWHALLHLLGNLPTGGRGGRRASGPHVVTARRPLRPPRRRPPAPTRPSAPPPIERGPFHRRGAPTPHPRRRGGGAKESHAMESLWQPSICVVIEFSRMITKTKATAVVQAVAARRAGRTAAAGAMRSFYGASQEPCWARGAGGGGAAAGGGRAAFRHSPGGV